MGNTPLLNTSGTRTAFANLTRPAGLKGKGMQLGKKSKATDMYERVRGEMGGEIDDSPLVAPTPSAAAATPEPRASTTMDRDAIHVIISETISANLSREGAVNSLSVNGDLTLRISDPSLTRIQLGLTANASHGAQFRTHPKVDRGAFNSTKVIQMANTAQGFPVNNSVGVLRWRASPKTDDASACPITFTVWINKEADKYNMTVEYELTGSDPLKDVSVLIPYQTAEPLVSSFDATYDVMGDVVEWTIGDVNEENSTGSFEFEAEADDENEFFPMTVRFQKTSPYVDVDVRFPGAAFFVYVANTVFRYRMFPSSRWRRRSPSPRTSGLLLRTLSLSSWGSGLESAGVGAGSIVAGSRRKWLACMGDRLRHRSVTRKWTIYAISQ